MLLEKLEANVYQETSWHNSLIRIKPVKIDKEDRYVCPICKYFNIEHSLYPPQSNCPVCGVNISW